MMKRLIWFLGCIVLVILVIVTIRHPRWWKEVAFLPPRPVKYDCSEIETEINKYDWDTELALAVAKAESGCYADARGDDDLIYVENGREYGYSVGAFQVRILPGREDCDTFDIEKNIFCAYTIYQSADNSFTPWSMWNNGEYKKYLWHPLL